MANATNNKSKPATQPNRFKPASGPKPTPAPVTAAKPADDDDIDDIDAPTAAGAKDDSFSKLAPAQKVSVRLGNEVTRLTRQLESIANWPGDALIPIRASLGDALAGLKLAAEGLAEMPTDYRPRVAKASSSGSKAELKAGDKIRITEKRVPEYEGVLEPELMRGIEVVEIRGNKVIAKTSDGMRAMFARGHVCLDAEAAA